MGVNNRRFSRLVPPTAAVDATIIAASVVQPPSSAHAASPLSGETVTTQDVQEALDNVSDGLLKTAVTASGLVARGQYPQLSTRNGFTARCVS